MPVSFLCGQTWLPTTPSDSSLQLKPFNCQTETLGPILPLEGNAWGPGAWSSEVSQRYRILHSKNAPLQAGFRPRPGQPAPGAAGSASPVSDSPSRVRDSTAWPQTVHEGLRSHKALLSSLAAGTLLVKFSLRDCCVLLSKSQGPHLQSFTYGRGRLSLSALRSWFLRLALQNPLARPHTAQTKPFLRGGGST